MSEPEIIFEARGVAKAFGATVLFENADLTLVRGETLAIIGESGSGKSVFLKLLAGLLPVDEGEIFYKGKSVADMDRAALDKLHREVGYVFQNDALFDSMTVAENIGYALREHTKQSYEQIRERALQCLDIVNLRRTAIDEFPSGLSGGMRKRVALARAIAIEPEIILYDEPTQGLDPQNITNIAQMIEELQRTLHVTSIVVTHDMRTAFGASNRIAMLHEHRFAYVGTPEELMKSEDAPIREFIDDAMDELRALFDEDEDDTKVRTAGTTQVAPADPTQAAPADTTEVAPVDKTQVAPVDKTQVAPVDETQVAPVDKTQVAPAPVDRKD